MPSLDYRSHGRIVTLPHVTYPAEPRTPLERILRERRMTQEELGRLTGIARTQMNGYVTGRVGLGLRNAYRIADALGVNPSDLLPPAKRPNGLAAELRELREAVDLNRDLLVTRDAGQVRRTDERYDAINGLCQTLSTRLEAVEGALSELDRASRRSFELLTRQVEALVALQTRSSRADEDAAAH